MMRRVIFLFLLIQSVSCSKAQKVEELSFKHTNDLIDEKSEYLQQHAHNPVDWMPWGEKAFEKAELENKLVLISIGYSSCHWCHVMEKESFENEEIAKYMNEHFICIKVDREERTDVDKMYMSAVSLIMKNTGWPLNCFTLPNGRPFYGGTYYAPGEWKKLLEAIVDMQKQTPEKIIQFADELEEGIINSQFIPIDKEAKTFEKADIHEAVGKFKPHLDFKKGGLQSSGNKFPMSSNLNLIMNYAFLEKDSSLMNYVFTSFDEMSYGGIYDQIGGGFARYSTDENWKVPHFEKMLYINAQLISNYSDAYKISKNENYKRVIVQTIDWLKREMTNEDGGFYASQDADSEGEEGLYYTWTRSELKAILKEDFEWVKNYFEINPLGLFEGDRYILIRSSKDMDFAKSRKWKLETLYSKLDGVFDKLMQVRLQRIKPATDNKIITPWNAMMISGLVDAYEAFGDEEYLNLAKNSMMNILNSIDENEKIPHIIASHSKIGYLDDYAFTIKALIDLYQVTFDVTYLNEAKRLSENAIKSFKDDESPYFIYSTTDKRLKTKSIELLDNSIASSNAVMAENLFLLGLIFENDTFTKMSREMCLNMKTPFIENGVSFSYWGKVIQYFSSPYYEVVIAGDNTKREQKEWMQQFIPNALVLGGKSSLPLLQEKMNVKVPTIFVCKEKVCQKPVFTIKEALKLMPL